MFMMLNWPKNGKGYSQSNIVEFALCSLVFKTVSEMSICYCQTGSTFVRTSCIHLAISLKAPGHWENHRLTMNPCTVSW